MTTATPVDEAEAATTAATPAAQADPTPEGGARASAAEGECEAEGGPPSLESLLHSSIGGRAETVGAELTGARAEPAEERIHDLRVAVRRLRAALDAFAPLLPKRRAKKTARALRTLRRCLGATRDLDVHAALLASLVPSSAPPTERAAAEHLLDRLGEHAAAEREAVREHIAAACPEELARGTAKLLRRAALPKSWRGLSLAEVAHERIVGLAVPAFAALEAATHGDATDPLPAHDEDLHALRIALKRYRYTLELFEEAFAEGYATLLGEAKVLQELLGGYLDLALLRAYLDAETARLAGARRPLLADGAQAIDARAGARQAELRAALRQTARGRTAKELAAEVAAGLCVAAGEGDTGSAR